MSALPEMGTLVLADLSGYTAYLSRSELDHAPAIAGDLLETIVGRLDPPVWADASGTEPALPLVRPSRRKPARVERRAVVYGRAGARYIATVVLGTG